MDRRRLGNTDLHVTPIGFGAFKIGRNEAIKYPAGYDLPTEQAASELLHAVLDLGVNFIDTAPAYGLSEQRIGKAIADRRDEYILCTKAGETFEQGRSTYDFSAAAVTRSAERSLKLLRTDHLDLLLIHSDGNDVHVLERTDAVDTLHKLRRRGLTRHVGFSGKTEAGLRGCLDWADAVMVEFNSNRTDLLPAMQTAHQQGVGVVVKKALASGRLPADAALRFVLTQDCVGAAVVGGLNAAHLAANVKLAETLRG